MLLQHNTNIRLKDTGECFCVSSLYEHKVNKHKSCPHCGLKLPFEQKMDFFDNCHLLLRHDVK